MLNHARSPLPLEGTDPLEGYLPGVRENTSIKGFESSIKKQDNQRQELSSLYQDRGLPNHSALSESKVQYGPVPPQSVLALIYRANNIKHLIDQLNDHPTILQGHRVEVQLIGGNLTIDQMEDKARHQNFRLYNSKISTHKYKLLLSKGEDPNIRNNNELLLSKGTEFNIGK